MRILLDAGIFIHAEFARPAVKSFTERWGGMVPLPPVHGLKRKMPKKHQKHIDALFTVGRLIGEKVVEAYDYAEVSLEWRRGATSISACNALRNCEVHRCRPAIERSRFRTTTDIIDWFSKGGKKDIKRGVALGQANQLSFLELLYTLRKKDVETLISHAEELQLSAFELDSLRDIEWFQFLCKRSGSAENYTDVFHLWTARRNNLDAVLTLDGPLLELVSRVRREKSKFARSLQMTADVLYPLDLLERLGIKELDPVPMEFDRFYHMRELPK